MPNINPEDDLMRFRTAWLRAIALAWEDTTFQDGLLADPKTALAGSPIGFQWPWTGIVDVSVALDNSFVWKDTAKRGSKAGWQWPKVRTPNEWLVLSLPLLPKGVNGVDIDEVDLPSALADYYTAQPTLFGSSNTATIRAFVSRTTSPTFIGPGTDFMNFEVALLLVLAERWKNRKKLGTGSIGQQSLKASLKSYAKKYSIPWAFSISVEDDPTIRWDKSNGRWTTPTPHRLQLELPTVPNNPTSRTVALAEYNATGAEFPFSCCCA